MQIVQKILAKTSIQLLLSLLIICASLYLIIFIQTKSAVPVSNALFGIAFALITPIVVGLNELTGSQHYALGNPFFYLTELITIISYVGFYFICKKTSKPELRIILFSISFTIIGLCGLYLAQYIAV